MNDLETSPYEEKTGETYALTLYMAGDVETAKRIVREFCHNHGACFTVEQTLFIYTGGEENGFKVGNLYYPRRPSSRNDMWKQMVELAQRLLVACNQRTFLVVGSDETKWWRLDPPGHRP